MGYANTFIAVAGDCRAATGEIPPERAGGPTVASTQYAMLTAAPGRWTEEDVLLASSPQVRGHDVSETELTSGDVPDDVGQRCLALAAALGLEFAGIDLRRTPDGEYVCFEVNPSPAFSFYEEATGQPIADAPARYLAGLE